MELQAVNFCRAALERQKMYVENLRGAVLSVPIVDGLPHARAEESIVEKTAEKILDAQQELQHLEAALVDCQIELTRQIFLRVPCRINAELLSRRYVRGESFKQIAQEMCLSEPRIYARHRQAVSDFNANQKKPEC